MAALFAELGRLTLLSEPEKMLRDRGFRWVEYGARDRERSE